MEDADFERFMAEAANLPQAEKDKLIRALMEDGPIVVRSLSEMADDLKKHVLAMNAVFEHNRDRNTLTINAAYPYEVDLDRIGSMEGLLAWVLHLLEKTWMTRELLEEFIERVCRIKGWQRPQV